LRALWALPIGNAGALSICGQGMKLDAFPMCRSRAIAAAAMLTVLAGCSADSSGDQWLAANQAALMRVAPRPLPAAETLRFESRPPGADVRTAEGQACRTPCALALPLRSQTVTFSMSGYLPQIIPVQVMQPAERSEVTFESEPPSFAPNPVTVALEAAPPPPPVAQAPPSIKPKRVVRRPPPSAPQPPAVQAVPIAASTSPLPPPR
jgi:hypothetical protein